MSTSKLIKTRNMAMNKDKNLVNTINDHTDKGFKIS